MFAEMHGEKSSYKPKCSLLVNACLTYDDSALQRLQIFFLFANLKNELSDRLIVGL